MGFAACYYRPVARRSLALFPWQSVLVNQLPAGCTDCTAQAAVIAETGSQSMSSVFAGLCWLSLRVDCLSLLPSLPPTHTPPPLFLSPPPLVRRDCVCVCVCVCDTERETERQRQRETQKQRDRDRQRQKQRDRDRNRETEETNKDRQRGRERDRERGVGWGEEEGENMK